MELVCFHKALLFTEANERFPPSLQDPLPAFVSLKAIPP